MRKMQTVKKHATHGVTGFELSKKVLNNLSQYNLRPTAKLVLLFLCDCYNPEHGKMFPKQKTIADKLGVSEVSVIRAIQELHKEGLIISERKYINTYRFTSKIVEEQPTNEDNEMIVETYQKDKEPIKKIAPCIEQITEQKKEQTSIVDFKILKEYAEQRGAKNITAYINALKKSGSAEKIIKEYKIKQNADNFAKKQCAETLQRVAEFQEMKNTAVAPTDEWRKLKAMLMQM